MVKAYVLRHVTDNSDIDMESIEETLRDYVKIVPAKSIKGGDDMFGNMLEGDILNVRKVVDTVVEEVNKFMEKEDLGCFIPYAFMEYDEYNEGTFFIFLKDGDVDTIMSMASIVSDYGYYMKTGRSLLHWTNSNYEIIGVYEVE